MWLRWFPWGLLVSRAARARGLVDPVKVLLRWSGSWRGAPLRVEVRLPGFTAVDVPAGQGSALLEPEAGS